MTEVNNAQSAPKNAGISWKQGLLIALGVPILIVPSLADISLIMWGLAIVIWVVSVISGFMLNLTLAEICSTFGTAGVGGTIQHVFIDDEKYKNKKVNTGRLIGGLGAWCYFDAWVVVVPIFTIMAAEYLIGYFDFLGDISGWTKVGFYLVIGALMYSFIIFSGRKGLDQGAKLQLILAIITLVPIVVIVIAPLFIGHFNFDYIAGEFNGGGVGFDANSILMIFGCLSIAQWSACAWETAAAYGGDYKDPATDAPKAIMACGVACLVLYFVISFFMYGDLGYAGIESAGAATLVPIAEDAFGKSAGLIAVLLLICGMIMIVQTGMLGACKTLESMAKDGNMPAAFAKTNKYGVPMNALYFEAGIGFVVLISGITSSELLAACCLGYAIAHCLVQLSFLKARRDPRFKDMERVYRVPEFLYYGSFAMVCWEVCLMAGILYYLYTQMGVGYMILGPVLSFSFVPYWILQQKWNKSRHPEIPNGLNDVAPVNSNPTGH